MKRTKNDYVANIGMSRTDLTGAMTPHTQKRFKLAGSSKKEEYFCGNIIQICNFSNLSYLIHEFNMHLI